MKQLFSYAAFAAACIIVSTSCSDSLSEIGASTRPDTDGISIKTSTYEVPVQTVYRDSVYVRTGYPLLGSLTDPYFGEINAGYLAQFYANKETSMNVSSNNSDSLIFNILRTSLIREFEAKEPGQWDPSGRYQSRFDSLVGNKIDSMTIRIYYTSYYGDSLAPMQVSIYGLNPEVDFEELPESEFYSNNTFSAMYSEKNLLGRKAFTSANRELSDSIRSGSDYLNYLEVKLDDKYKDEFLRYALKAELARDGKVNAPGIVDIFSDPSLLRTNWLSGVCVKPTFGDGSLIKVFYTAIYLFYSSYHRYAPDGTLLRNAADDGDSAYVIPHTSYIAVTPDVIQMTGLNFADERKDERMSYSDTAFISSPQGYYATIDLPVGQMIGTMMSDPQRNDSSYFLNAANFYLKAYKPFGYDLSKTPVPTLLMVQMDSINTFFEEGSLPNSATSCYATFSCDSVPSDIYKNPNEGLYYYSFGNINSVILGLAKNQGWGKDKVETVEQWEKLLKANGKITEGQTVNDYVVRMALLPVDVTTNSTYGTLLSVANYILPTSIRLQKGKDKQSIQMIYTLEGSN